MSIVIDLTQDEETLVRTIAGQAGSIQQRTLPILFIAICGASKSRSVKGCRQMVTRKQCGGLGIYTLAIFARALISMRRFPMNFGWMKHETAL